MQPGGIIFNKVETKDLCTVRYSSISNKGLLFCNFEVCRASRPAYLDRPRSHALFVDLRIFSRLTSSNIQSTLMQLLFSFDQGTSVSCKLSLVNFHQLSSMFDQSFNLNCTILNLPVDMSLLPNQISSESISIYKNYLLLSFLMLTLSTSQNEYH